MNNLAHLTNQPVLLRVPVRDEAGEPTGEVLEYRVHPLTYADYGELQTWVNEQFPDPFETARGAIAKAARDQQPFNVTQEQFLLKNAAELALRPRHLIGTTEADTLLLSGEGIKQILLLAIRKGNPDFTPAHAERLCRYMTNADVIKAYAITQVNLMMSDPKASALDVQPTTNGHGCSTSRRTRRAQKK